MRKLYSPSYGRLHGVVPVARGGTGVKTAPQALVNLDLLDPSAVGQPGGVVKLVGGLIPNNQLSTDTSLLPTLKGPNSVLVGMEATYQITNYDLDTGYDIRTSSAGVTILVQDNGTFILASSDTGTKYFTINGQEYSVQVTNISPSQPTINSPTTGVTNQAAAVQFIASAFSMPSGYPGTETHRNTDWQLSTSATFATISHTSLADSANKTAWIANNLQPNTTYYARVRYRGQNTGESEWSSPVTLSTKTMFLQTVALQQKATAVNTFSGDEFFGCATAVDLTGSCYFVGSYGANGNGLVYAFVKTALTWEYKQTIAAVVGSGASDQFGKALAVSADSSVFVATDPTNSAVYSYTRVSDGTWEFRQRIVPDNVATGDLFGNSIAISQDGTTMVVGARGKNGGGGAVYIYMRNGDSRFFQAQVTSQDNTANDFFGESVSLSENGNVLAVGAKGKTSGRGAVYIFTRANASWGQQWTQQGTATGSQYGNSVSLSSDGTTLAVGAPNENSSVGSAYVYIRGASWSLQRKLVGSINGTAETGLGGFGFSLSLTGTGDGLVVGAVYRDNYKGMAYLFTRENGTWQQNQRFAPPDLADSAFFGYCISIAGNSSVVSVGAYTNSNDVPSLGSSYLYA